MIKVYENNFDFLKDNKEYINENKLIDKLFLEISSNNVIKTSVDNYFIKVENGTEFLLLFCLKSRALIWGSNKLLLEMIKTLVDYNFTLVDMIAERKLLEEFNKIYNDLTKYNVLKMEEINIDNNSGNKLWESSYEKGDYETAIFAGGCFWCMAKPYYSYKGVLSVISGYIGGKVFNPTYEQTKKGNTGHQEAVKIIYNKNKIKYEQLLEIFFTGIDPFDDGGQYGDRGSNYTTGIYIIEAYQEELSRIYIRKVEKESNKKVAVKIFENNIFFKAEEYHQDYYIKHPDAFEKEKIYSSRFDKPLIGRYHKDGKNYEIEVKDDRVINKKEIEYIDNYENPIELLEIIDKLTNK